MLKREFNLSLVEVLDGDVHEGGQVDPNRENVPWVRLNVNRETELDVLSLHCVQFRCLHHFPKVFERGEGGVQRETPHTPILVLRGQFIQLLQQKKRVREIEGEDLTYLGDM